MDEMACCITGHRNLNDKDTEVIRQNLKTEILVAIQDGYTTFLSGFAEGVDLMFAEIVAELKQEHPIFLEAALPYAGRMAHKSVQPMLTHCDGIRVVSEQYLPGCFLRRNRYLVQRYSRVIAVHDGRSTGGTVYTMQYAGKMGRDLREIRV